MLDRLQPRRDTALNPDPNREAQGSGVILRIFCQSAT
jgi:hypothetical protein